MWCWSIARIEVTTRAPERDMLVDRTDRGDSSPNLSRKRFQLVTGALEAVVAENAATLPYVLTLQCHGNDSRSRVC
jgi:hypothetical protein